jgi:hypothetical protein
MPGYFPEVVMKPERSLKICVLNGSRQIDMVIDKNWITLNVAPEAGLPKGIYQLADAIDPVESRSTEVFSQAILHVNDRNVWQLSEKGIIKHARSLFAGEPKVGHTYDVAYERGQGIVVDVVRQDRIENRGHALDSDLSLNR